MAARVLTPLFWQSRRDRDAFFNRPQLGDEASGQAVQTTVVAKIIKGGWAAPSN